MQDKNQHNYHFNYGYKSALSDNIDIIDDYLNVIKDYKDYYVKTFYSNGLFSKKLIKNTK